MKKFIIIALILVAVAAGVYVYKNKSSGGAAGSIADVFSGKVSSNSAVLEYVPADTVFFGGSLKPMSFKESMELSRNMGFDFSTMAALSDDDTLELSDDDSDGVKVLLGIYQAYSKALASDDLPKALGITDKLDGAVYTVGVLPVLRASLDGSDTFEQMLLAIEKEHNITPKAGTIDGVSYREYSFESNAPFNLVISTANNFLVATLNSPLEDSKDLALTLGAKKPAKSIIDSETLNRVSSKFDYNGVGVFFLDNLGITKGLTDPQSNSFGVMVDDLNKAFGDGDDLKEIQNPACQKEIQGLVGNWPSLSGGYTKINDNNSKFKVVFEGTNSDLLKVLQTLRGHLSPTVTNSDNIFGFAMGINMAELTPVITDVWKRLTKDPYQCEVLAGIQEDMKRSNPAMEMGIFSSMVGDIKGIGLGVLDLDIDTLMQAKENPMLAAEGISLLVTLTADDPMALIQRTANFQPMLANIELEDGAEPQALPLPISVEVNGTLRGHDLLISFGDKANAVAKEHSANSTIDYNGIIAFNMDMGKYLKIISLAVEESSEELTEEQRRAFASFKNINAYVNETIDFTDHGLEVNVEMETK